MPASLWQNVLHNTIAEPPVKLLKELYDISERSCAKWPIEMRYPMLMVIIW